MSGSLFENVDAKGYGGIWRLWKIGSIGLFGVFVACAIDIAVSMRKYAGR